jgi:hypothetical protein
VRPGRIDVKIEYKKANRIQARALFDRFFPATRFEPSRLIEDTESQPQPGLRRRLGGSAPSGVDEKSMTLVASRKPSTYTDKVLPIRAPPPGVSLAELAEEFAALVPEGEFSAAELQGYLLTCKWDPMSSVEGFPAWMARERAEREEKAQREQERAKKAAERSAFGPPNGGYATDAFGGPRHGPPGMGPGPGFGRQPSGGPPGRRGRGRGGPDRGGRVPPPHDWQDFDGTSASPSGQEENGARTSRSPSPYEAVSE